jgi:hypothetical protein
MHIYVYVFLILLYVLLWVASDLTYEKSVIKVTNLLLIESPSPH